MCRGVDDDWAWEIRDEAMKKHTRNTIISLSGIDTDRAWKIRDRHMSKKYGNELLYSVKFMDNERAWEIREKYLETHPAFVIISLAGLSTPRAHQIRRMFMGKAPKLVLTCDPNPATTGPRGRRTIGKDKALVKSLALAAPPAGWRRFALSWKAGKLRMGVDDGKPAEIAFKGFGIGRPLGKELTGLPNVTFGRGAEAFDEIRCSRAAD